MNGRRSTLARSGADFVAGAALSQFQVFPRLETHGRRINFARSSAEFVAGAASSAEFVAGAALSQGQIQHFRKVKCRIRGRRITFARSSAEFVAGAALSHGQVKISWHAQHFRQVNFCSRGSKIVTFKYGSSTRSQLSQLGLQNRIFLVRK